MSEKHDDLEFVDAASERMLGQFIRIVSPLRLKWNPKPDITTYELALCLPLIFRFDVMPYDINKDAAYMRHFDIIDPNEPG